MQHHANHGAPLAVEPACCVCLCDPCALIAAVGRSSERPSTTTRKITLPSENYPMSPGQCLGSNYRMRLAEIEGSVANDLVLNSGRAVTVKPTLFFRGAIAPSGRRRARRETSSRRHRRALRSAAFVVAVEACLWEKRSLPPPLKVLCACTV